MSALHYDASYERMNFLPLVWHSSSADDPYHYPISSAAFPPLPELGGSCAEVQVVHSYNLR